MKELTPVILSASENYRIVFMNRYGQNLYSYIRSLSSKSRKINTRLKKYLMRNSGVAYQ